MDSFETLLGLMNTANVPPKEFTKKNIRLGTPVAAEVEGEHDTRMRVEGIPGFGYFNEVEISYSRIPLVDYLGDAVVRSIVPITKEALMVQLNAVYDLELTEADLEDFEIPPINQNESALITLTAKDASIGFKGSHDITYTYGRPLLQSVITVRDLAVLQFIIPANQYKSALHLTWGRDFTSLRDALKIDKDGTYTDWDALQSGCQFMSIPSWLQGKIIDIPTSADPLANRKFDRVVIQRWVSSSGMLGDLYFHYNLFDEV